MHAAATAPTGMIQSLIAGACIALVPLKGGQPVDYLHRLQTYGDDLAEEADDVFRIVGTIRVVGDAVAYIGAHLIFVHHPFERAAVAEAIFKRLGRDVFQRQAFVAGCSRARICR
jgi:hypothetical protein